MIDKLKELVSKKYPLVFHATNDQAVLWSAALDAALYIELGYEIEEPNEEDTYYPTALPLRGAIGPPLFAVIIFQEGENLYVEF